MIDTEPQVKDSGRYTVVQTAKALEVSRQTIHRHSTSPDKPLKCSTHKVTGKKLYLGSDIKKFWKATF